MISRVDVAGLRGQAALVSYVRATAVVAVADAVAIGTGLAVLGGPLAMPLAALVFIGAFIPIIGPTIDCWTRARGVLLAARCPDCRARAVAPDTELPDDTPRQVRHWRHHTPVHQLNPP